MVVFVDLTLTQKQGLSPAMQTSMHLLQMNNLQLRTYIADLMYRNPVVELECPEIDFKPNPFERSRSTRTNHLSDQQDEQDDYTAEQSAEQDPLHDLFLQSAALDLKQSDAEILRYLILSLDENGFLTESVSESARILQVSEQQVQSNIVRLQSMEPAGIGAANLSDCLVLQLQRMTPVNSIAVQIAASFLDQLAKQQTGTIAKALGVTRAEVLEACELIRTLNPRPMNGLGVRSETPYILPDFYITEENGQLHIIMNDYYLPKIIIDPTYQQIIQSGTLDKSDQEYIQKNYKEAEEIVNFISYRKSTMQKVMQYILHAQKAFFLSGPGHRTAMNNAEIAAALTEQGIKSPKGKDFWRAATIRGILRNEKYCGDALMQKTCTIDFREHKSVKNTMLNKYFKEEHHTAIIKKSDWQKVQQILDEKPLPGKSARLHAMPKRFTVTRSKDKYFRGYIILDPRWTASERRELLKELKNL